MGMPYTRSHLVLVYLMFQIELLSTPLLGFFERARKKSRIRETKHISTDADSSTDTIVGWTGRQTLRTSPWTSDATHQSMDPKKLHEKGTDRPTYIHTSRLLDRIGPVGQFSENPQYNTENQCTS